MKLATFFRLVDSARFPRGRFSVREDGLVFGQIEVSFIYRTRDIANRKWINVAQIAKVDESLIVGMSIKQVDAFIFSIVLRAVEHEAREWFTVEGEHVMNPHLVER